MENVGLPGGYASVTRLIKRALQSRRLHPELLLAECCSCGAAVLGPQPPERCPTCGWMLMLFGPGGDNEARARHPSVREAQPTALPAPLGRSSQAFPQVTGLAPCSRARWMGPGDGPPESHSRSRHARPPPVQSGRTQRQVPASPERASRNAGTPALPSPDQTRPPLAVQHDRGETANRRPSNTQRKEKPHEHQQAQVQRPGRQDSE